MSETFRHTIIDWKGWPAKHRPAARMALAEFLDRPRDCEILFTGYGSIARLGGEEAETYKVTTSIYRFLVAHITRFDLIIVQPMNDDLGGIPETNDRSNENPIVGECACNAR